MSMHAFQVIATAFLWIARVAPLEAFFVLSPHHGAKRSVLTLGCAAMPRIKNDDKKAATTTIPTKLLHRYIHGKSRASSYPETTTAANTPLSPPPSPRAAAATTTSGSGSGSMMSLTTFLQGQPLESVFASIQMACQDISKLVHLASFGGGQSTHHDDNAIISGLHNGGGSMNIHGEEQKKLDVMANDIMKQALAKAGTVTLLVSEEEEEPISLPRRPSKKSKKASTLSEKSYIVAFDPLDGSSNIDVGIPVGTIFGIFEHHNGDVDDDDDDSDVLQPGRQLVAAGYCLYSAATTLVITLGNGVYGFTLDAAGAAAGGGRDDGGGEFVLTHPDMKIPLRGSIYSFNEGNRWDWDEPVQDYITNIQKGCGETQCKYSGRLVGSMVADIHRTLQYGGIFGYPSDSKNANGKLRLLYEAAPMAFLVEQAGGRGTTGTVPLRNVQPSHLHERVPCILGSRDDVLELESYYNPATTSNIEGTTAQRGNKNNNNNIKKKKPLNKLQAGTNSLSRLDEMLLLEYRWQLLE